MFIADLKFWVVDASKSMHIILSLTLIDTEYLSFGAENVSGLKALKTPLTHSIDGSPILIDANFFIATQPSLNTKQDLSRSFLEVML